MHPSFVHRWKLSLAAVALIAMTTAPLAAQQDRHISVKASSPEELAASGEWSQVSEDVWQRDIDGVRAELAFGVSALEASLDHIESEIKRLGTPQTRRQQLDLMELELRRDELHDAARRILASNKSTQTTQQTICGGSATFTHWYGQTWFFTHSVRSTSSFGMPGPVSPYTKTAYARAKACSSSNPSLCDAPAPVSASTTSYAVTAEALASWHPASGAPREAFGYVLVVGACTDIRSFSTSVPN